MPKDLMELRGFFQGIVSNASEYDIPQESASESWDVDPVSSNGQLQGIADHEQLSEKNMQTFCNINDDGTNVVIGVADDDAVYINEDLDNASTTNTFAKLSVQSSEAINAQPLMFKYARNALIATGNQQANEVLFVGKDKHKQWGIDPTQDWFSEDADLKSGTTIPEFTKVFPTDISGDFIGYIRGDSRLYKLTKANSQYKLDVKGEPLHDDRIISCACMSSSSSQIWVWMQKPDGTEKYIYKVAVADLTETDKHSVNTWYEWNFIDPGSQTRTAVADVRDILEHQGHWFITAKFNGKTDWEGFLFVGEVPGASANVNFYDMTPWTDRYDNQIGSWKLRDLSDTANVTNTSVNVSSGSTYDLGDDAVHCFTVYDENPNSLKFDDETNDPLAFSFFECGTSSFGHGSEAGKLVIMSHRYEYDSENVSVFDQSGDAVFSNESIDAIGSASYDNIVDIGKTELTNEHYSFLPQDGGSNAGLAKGLGRTNTDVENVHLLDNPNNVIVTSYNTIIFCLYPKGDKNLNPMICYIHYDMAGNLDKIKVVRTDDFNTGYCDDISTDADTELGTTGDIFRFFVDSGDLGSPMTAAEATKRRESPKLAWDDRRRVLFVGMRRPMAIPWWLSKWNGDGIQDHIDQAFDTLQHDIIWPYDTQENTDEAWAWGDRETSHTGGGTTSNRGRAYVKTCTYNHFLNQFIMVFHGYSSGASGDEAEKIVVYDVSYANHDQASPYDIDHETDPANINPEYDAESEIDELSDEDRSYGTIWPPIFTKNTSADTNYVEVTDDTKIVQIASVSSRSGITIERYGGGESTLNYRINTASARGSAVVLENENGEQLTTNLGSNFWRLPFVVNETQQTLFAYDRKDGNDVAVIRILDLIGRETSLTAEERTIATLDALQDDMRGYKFLFLSQRGPLSAWMLDRKFHRDYYIDTLMVSESSVSGSSVTWKLDNIDYKWEDKAITTPEGGLVTTADNDVFLCGIEFEQSTYFKYGEGANDKLDCRFSAVYIKWTSSTTIANEYDDDNGEEIRDRLMITSNAKVGHMLVSSDQTNITGCSSIGKGAGGADIFIYTSQVSEEAPKIIWFSLDPIASIVTNYTATVPANNIKTENKFNQIVPCGYVDASQWQIHLFEAVSSGLWQYYDISNSAPFSYSSINETLGNMVQLIISDTATDSSNFTDGVDSRYCFTFVYDGFQESPLSEWELVANGDPAKVKEVKIRLWNPDSLSRRITHVHMYRSENNLVDDEAWTYYRFVKRMPVDSKWDLVEDPGGDEYRQFIFNDKGKMGATYESVTGVSENIESYKCKFTCGHIYNGSLFFANANIKFLEDEQTYVFKSQTNKPLMVDYSKDFVILPEVLNAIGSFGNRVFGFSDAGLYRIEPNNMILEHIFEGSGALSQRSIVSVDEGLFYADNNAVWHLTGPIPKRISLPIEHGMNYSYDQKSVSKQVPILAWDPKRQSLLVFLQKAGGIKWCLTYNLPRKRWDVVTFDDTQTINDVIMQYEGNVYIADENKIWNFCSKTSGNREFNWFSKKLEARRPELEKTWKFVQKTGNGSLSYTTDDGDWTEFQFEGVSGGISRVLPAEKNSKFIKLHLKGSGYRYIDSVGITYQNKRIGAGLSANAEDSEIDNSPPPE